MIRSSVFIVLLALSQYAQAFSYTLEITEQELQEKVAAMMPLERKNQFASVTISDPKVDLIKQSNEIGVFAKVSIIVLGGIKGSGSVKIQGTLSYDAAQGAFYLHEPKVVGLTIDNAPKQFSLNAQKITQRALTKAMLKYPIYQFKDRNTKEKMAKAALESVTVENGKLLVKLSVF